MPAISVRKSVTPDAIICLEDGKKFKSLKRHLRTTYDMTPEQYRAKWNLPPTIRWSRPTTPRLAPNLLKQWASGQQRKKRTDPVEAAAEAAIREGPPHQENCLRPSAYTANPEAPGLAHYQMEWVTLPVQPLRPDSPFKNMRVSDKSDVALSLVNGIARSIRPRRSNEQIGKQERRWIEIIQNRFWGGAAAAPQPSSISQGRDLIRLLGPRARHSG